MLNKIEIRYGLLSWFIFSLEEFVLRPSYTPTRNIVLSSAPSPLQMQNRFSMELGTPNEIARRIGNRKVWIYQPDSLT